MKVNAYGDFVARGSPLKRIMMLCRAIGAGRTVSIRELQPKLATSRRTLFRDFDYLRSIGIKVVTRKKGHSIPSSVAQCKAAIHGEVVASLIRFLKVHLK